MPFTVLAALRLCLEATYERGQMFNPLNLDEEPDDEDENVTVASLAQGQAGPQVGPQVASRRTGRITGILRIDPESDDETDDESDVEGGTVVTELD